MRPGTNRTDVETKDSDLIPAISQEETQNVKKTPENAARALPRRWHDNS
jgi:hypothetical protein